MALPRKPVVAPAKAKAPAFDEAAWMKRMRGDIQRNKEADQRAAARAPKAAPKPKDVLDIGEKEVFGLRSRRNMANRMMKEMK